MTLYDEANLIAKEILSDPDLKQDIVKLIQITPGTGPADEPGQSTETEYTLDAVVKGAPYKYLKEGFATVIDQMVTAATIDDVTPTKNDFIDINGVRCKIIEDISSPGAGTRVVWKFLVRK